MIDVTVTVTGPGGCISGEIEIIRRALTAAGINVTIADPHPPVEGFTEVLDKYIASGRMSQTNVKIIAMHCPWGG